MEVHLGGFKNEAECQTDQYPYAKEGESPREARSSTTTGALVLDEAQKSLEVFHSNVRLDLHSRTRVGGW